MNEENLTIRENVFSILVQNPLDNSKEVSNIGELDSENSNIINIEITESIEKELANIHEFDFDCFEFCQKHGEVGLVYLMVHIFNENSLFTKLNIDKNLFVKFTYKIATG